MMNAADYFSGERRLRIRNAVCEAEKLTSGELRVYIENHCRQDVLQRALMVFRELQMEKTDLRNGVLIYLAIKDHKFAIIGDEGIHTIVGPDFWDHIKTEMQRYFREGHFIEGLEYGIMEAGKALQTFFPNKEGDSNELSDDITIRKE